MADTKISALTSGNPAQSGDEIPIARSGANYKVTAASIAALGGGGAGTVTSVDVSGGTTGLTTSGGPVTSSGTITIAGTLTEANGGTGETTYTNGQLLIGNASGGLTKATLTAGSNVTITNGDGAITIAASGGGGGGLTWQSVQTGNFTASAGNAYPVNTTSAAITVTLPASPSAGDQIEFIDYARTFSLNNLTIDPNGGKINGLASNYVLNVGSQSAQLVYIDSTQGWLFYVFSTSDPNYVIEVISLGGGGGGRASGGGSGGIAYKTNLIVTENFTYTATIGAGGVGSSTSATNGGDSTFSGTGITSVVGYGGGAGKSASNGGDGGSGGGGQGGSTDSGVLRSGGLATQGSGGTTYYGNNGGTNASLQRSSGGGGGTGAVGGNGVTVSGGFNGGGAGGAGTSALNTWLTAISQGVNSGGTRYIGGGGGGTSSSSTAGTGGAGGVGGGGAGASTGTTSPTAGTVNTGGGGGGGWSTSGASGGSGLISIRYPGLQRGTGGTVVTTGGYTYHTFTATDTYTG